jgi:hypothetical protein
MGRTGLVLFALSGCAQLAGIDETSGGEPTSKVSLAFERVSIGATVVRAPLDLSANTATYLLPDETSPSGISLVAATLTPPDTWNAQFGEAALPPPVLFDLPDHPMPLKRIWDIPQADLLGSFNVLEHPNPIPAPMTATVTLSIQLQQPWTGAHSLSVLTVGNWTSLGITGARLPGEGAGAIPQFTYMFSESTSITGRPLELLTSDDAYLVLRYSGSQLIGRYIAEPKNQTEQMQNIGTLDMITPDVPLDVRVNQAQVQTRFAAVRPAVGNLGMSWAIRAAPGWQHGDTTGPQLHAGGVALTDPSTLTAMYANPFAAKDWKALFAWSTSSSRSYTPPSAMLPVTLGSGMQEIAEPTTGRMFDLPAGLPELISIDGRTLSVDGQVTIAPPTKAVRVTFVTDRTTNTLYQVELYELVPNNATPPTGLVYKRVVGAIGTKAEFDLPPNLFETGKLYTIRAGTISGSFPNAASEGDLRMREFPMASAYLDSGVFQVMP